MPNARMNKSQAGIKIAKRNVNDLRYADDTPLMAESQGELKSLLMRVKEESEKVNSVTMIMASGPITSWQIEGGKWKQWQILFSWAPKSLQIVTAAMKSKDLLLGRKVMTNLGSILKSRNFTLPAKIVVVQSSNRVQLFASPMDSSTPGFPVLHCSQSWQRSAQSKLWLFW